MTDEELLEILYKRYNLDVRELESKFGEYPFRMFVRRTLRVLEWMTDKEIEDYNDTQESFVVPISHKETMRVLRYGIVLIEIVR